MGRFVTSICFGSIDSVIWVSAAKIGRGLKEGINFLIYKLEPESSPLFSFLTRSFLNQLCQAPFLTLLCYVKKFNSSSGYRPRYYDSVPTSR